MTVLRALISNYKFLHLLSNYNHIFAAHVGTQTPELANCSFLGRKSRSCNTISKNCSVSLATMPSHCCSTPPPELWPKHAVQQKFTPNQTSYNSFVVAVLKETAHSSKLSPVNQGGFIMLSSTCTSNAQQAHLHTAGTGLPSPGFTSAFTFP